MTDDRTPGGDQRGGADAGTKRAGGGAGCTSALLFGIGIAALGLWWTAQMFSEGGDGTIFLAAAAAAFVIAIAVLLRGGSAKPPAE
jgi:apolipoprotein N-acyltransferase